MIFISITRLRLRSVWYLLPFMRTNQTALRQLKRESNFIKGKLLIDRKLTFWTMTAWASDGDMRAYRNSGAHLRVMPKLITWCNEAHVAHWSQETDTLPDWHEAYRRITAPDARVSKVRHPSKHHLAKSFLPPRYPSKLEAHLQPAKPAL